MNLGWVIAKSIFDLWCVAMSVLVVGLLAMCALGVFVKARDNWRLAHTPRACRTCGAMDLLNKHGRCPICEWVTSHWFELEFEFSKTVLEVRRMLAERRPR